MNFIICIILSWIFATISYHYGYYKGEKETSEKYNDAYKEL